MRASSIVAPSERNTSSACSSAAFGDGRRLDVRFVQMAQHADPQTLHAAAQCRAIVGNVVVRARRVLRVVAGDDTQKDRAILDCPGHRTGGVIAE